MVNSRNGLRPEQLVEILKMCFCGHIKEVHDDLNNKCCASMRDWKSRNYACTCVGFEWIENKKMDGV